MRARICCYFAAALLQRAYARHAAAAILLFTLRAYAATRAFTLR